MIIIRVFRKGLWIRPGSLYSPLAMLINSLLLDDTDNLFTVSLFLPCLPLPLSLCIYFTASSKWMLMERHFFSSPNSWWWRVHSNRSCYITSSIWQLLHFSKLQTYKFPSTEQNTSPAVCCWHALHSGHEDMHACGCTLVYAHLCRNCTVPVPFPCLTACCLLFSNKTSLHCCSDACFSLSVCTLRVRTYSVRTHSVRIPGANLPSFCHLLSTLFLHVSKLFLLPGACFSIAVRSVRFTSVGCCLLLSTLF